MFIYCITNLINGKQYVGKTTTTIEQRFKEHCRGSKKQYKNRPLYDAFNKYGIENFKIECLEEIEDESILSDREIYWINELGTYGKGGYNATKGGDGSSIYDPKDFVYLYNLGYSINKIAQEIGCDRETASRILKAHGVEIRSCDKKVRQYDLANNYIRTFDSQTKAAEWINEYIYPNKSVQNILSGINKCCLGKQQKSCGYRWQNDFDDIPMNNYHELYHTNNFTTKVQQYDLQMNLLNEFESIKDASIYLQTKNNLNKTIKNISTGISACCSGKQKTAFKYIWKYC